MAASGLFARRMRSCLTMLGILIGTSSVILLVAIGTGAGNAVVGQMATLGTNAIYVLPADNSGGQDGGGTRSRAARLTREDVRALRDRAQAPDIRTVAPAVARPVAATWNGVTAPVGSFVGIGPIYEEVGNFTMARGRFYDEQEEETHAKVAVVGPTVADRLFGKGIVPVGQAIAVEGTRFRVVGLTERQGDSGFGDQDDFVAVPLTTALDHVFGAVESYAAIAIQATSSDRAMAAEAQADAILRRNHGLRPTDSPDYSVVNSEQLVAASRATAAGFNRLLAALASIALVVGGIGVMNIMLVNVTDRTQEIGLRLAVGAHRRQIVGQFLFEAVVLAMVGGILGVVVGVGAARARFGSIEPIVSPFAVAVSFGASVLVGVIFGAYPASRAAKLKPYEALRFQ